HFLSSRLCVKLRSISRKAAKDAKKSKNATAKLFPDYSSRRAHYHGESARRNCMATAQPGTILRHLHRLVERHAEQGLSNGQLLHRFGAGREETAFAALMQRHGRLVWSVCRHVLSHHDAEDAFQATFLVLARRAASVRKAESVAGWLHGVAYRTAMRARHLD